MSDQASNLQVSNLEAAERFGPVPGFPGSCAGGLATLVYRSRSVRPMSLGDLERLAAAAQARNRSEAITGVVLYDEGWFFQWLEGPAASLDRVMRSINRDSRHTDIEVLARETDNLRSFARWDMKLALRDTGPWLPRRNIRKLPAAMLATMRRNPGQAMSLLSGLALRSVGSLLEEVILERVVPELGARLAPVAPIFALSEFKPEVTPATLAQPGQDAVRLAELLLADRMPEAEAAIALALVGAPTIGRIYPILAEPTSRHLGDLWMDDRCGEWEVTSALCRLQAVLRRSIAPPAALVTAALPRLALVVPQPGELHTLGTMVSEDRLLRAGSGVRMDFPTNDAALADLLASESFDTLHLWLSPAMHREDAVLRMAETVRTSRLASRRPGLAVLVGGRAFAEGQSSAEAVGADRLAVPGRMPHLAVASGPDPKLSWRAERGTTVGRHTGLRKAHAIHAA